MTDHGFDRSFDALSELLRDVSATDTVIPVLSTAPFTSPLGQIYVGGELMNYTSLGQGPVGEAIFNVVRDPLVARPHIGGEFVWQQRQGLLVGTGSTTGGGVLVPPRAITEFYGDVSIEAVPEEGKNRIYIPSRGVERYRFVDHFDQGAVSSAGTLGVGKWTWGLSAGSALTQYAGQAGHPGYIGLVTPATINTYAYLSSWTATFLPFNMRKLEFLFTPSQATGQVIWLGLNDLPPAGSSNAIYVRQDTSAGETTFRLSTYAGGVAAPAADTGLPVIGGAWYRATLTQRLLGVWRLDVTNLSTGQTGATEVAYSNPVVSMYIHVLMYAREAVAKALYLEYIAYEYEGLTYT